MPRIAIISHVYYLDQLEEILATLSRFPPGTKLIVTTTEENASRLRDKLISKTNVSIVPRPNRGRDIAPFIYLLQNGALNYYDIVLKIHTKKSPHLLDGDQRRRMIFALLAGNEAIIRWSCAQFADPMVGIVGPQSIFRTASRFWGANRGRVMELAARMRIPSPELGFFEGAMFWFRPSALQLLVDADIHLKEFELEDRQLDGTFHHAIERSFCVAARAAGFSTRTLDIWGRHRSPKTR
jgi:rhamnosyltransferase